MNCVNLRNTLEVHRKPWQATAGTLEYVPKTPTGNVFNVVTGWNWEKKYSPPGLPGWLSLTWVLGYQGEKPGEVKAVILPNVHRLLYTNMPATTICPINLKHGKCPWPGLEEAACNETVAFHSCCTSLHEALSCVKKFVFLVHCVCRMRTRHQCCLLVRFTYFKNCPLLESF